jgi:hypothetical protein
LETLALLDAAESKVYNSRHDYLARAKVPTWLVTMSRFRTDAVSLLVMDGAAWRVSSRFDDGVQGSIRVDAAAVTPDEIFSWRTVRGARFLQEKVLAGTLPPGAKESSDPNRPAAAGSVTITGKQALKQSGGRIPRRLPRETRLQRLVRGSPTVDGAGESTGSMQVPPPPPNESDVVD